MLVNFLEIDNDFIDVMGIKLVIGKDISNGLSSGMDPLYLVNETMVKKMGWDNPLKTAQANPVKALYYQ